MIVEEKRKAVLAAIEQAQHEVAFDKIATMVELLLVPASRLPLAAPGFAADAGFWMAPDFDEPLADFEEHE